MFVDQWILKDVEALGGGEIFFTGNIALLKSQHVCAWKNSVFEHGFAPCSVFLCELPLSNQ